MDSHANQLMVTDTAAQRIRALSQIAFPNSPSALVIGAMTIDGTLVGYDVAMVDLENLEDEYMVYDYGDGVTVYVHEDSVSDMDGASLELPKRPALKDDTAQLQIFNPNFRPPTKKDRNNGILGHRTNEPDVHDSAVSTHMIQFPI